VKKSNHINSRFSHNSIFKLNANQENIVSPFAKPNNQAKKDLKISSNSSFLELTTENVEMVLDEIRPALIADGGNIEIVSVNSQNRTIELNFQGACSSCPSSTVRSLQRLF
jgi:Fe-S cluster biogenesis protein NfuA